MTNNPALEPRALYSKSQVYIRRALRSKAEGDFEECLLWASLAVELIGKSALAKVHPALIADPAHSHSLFAACGRHLSPDVKTITAKTLFERLSHIEKSFDTRHQKFCEQLALRRNAELHSGESPFSGMDLEIWEREFWGTAETILFMQDESLESWLGAEDAKTPAKIVAEVENALGMRVHHRIAGCKAAFEELYKDPRQRAQAIEKSRTMSWKDLTWEGVALCPCPACASQGFLGGTLWSEDIIDSEPATPGMTQEDGWFPPMETVRKSFSVEIFQCPMCRFAVHGTKEVSIAELPEEFVEEEVREREFEDDYGND